jgi:hypothetical protein
LTTGPWHRGAPPALDGHEALADFFASILIDKQTGR